MRSIARHSTRLATASRTSNYSVSRQPKRQAKRSFSTTRQLSSEPRTPPGNFGNQSAVNNQREEAESHRVNSTTPEQEGEAERREEGSRQAAQVQDAEDKPAVETRKSSPRWNGRRKRVNEVPRPPPIPQWFLDKNVRLVEHIPGRNFGYTWEMR